MKNMLNLKALSFVKNIVLEDKCQDRMVTVWGADASSTCGVPTGSFLLARMNEDLDRLRALDSPKQTTRIKRGRKNAGVPQIDGKLATVEHTFAEYANFHKEHGDKELHDWLRKYIPTKNDNRDNSRPPYFPSVAHELCAHLVGSHKLRYFISLNFDEILESALEEEIGVKDIHVASSDDEFARLADTDIQEWESEFGFSGSGSFVLKPHGTISRRLTLKHLPKEVECFSDAKRAALTRVIRKRVIILLGFGNYNRDFQKVLLDASNRGELTTIVLVDKEPEKVMPVLPGGKVYPYEGSVDDFFRELLAQLEDDKQYRHNTQSSTRHRIRCHYFSLFSRELHAGGDETGFISQGEVLAGIPRWWLMVRVYELELLIHLLKTRGLFIQMAVLECGRLEEALRKSLEDLKGKDKRVDFLDLSPEGRLQAILGNELFGYSPVYDREAVRSLNAFWCFLLVQGNTPCWTHDEDMKSALRGTCQVIAERFSAWLIKESRHVPDDAKLWISAKIEGSQSFQNELGRLFEKLHGDFDIDLSDRDLSGTLRFKKARPIRERAEFLDWTNKALERSGGKWTRLRIGTVAGEWLASKLAAVQHNGSPTVMKTIDVISNLDVFTQKGSFRPYQLFHYRNVVESLKQLIMELERLKCEVETFTLYGVQNWEDHMLLVEADTVLQGGLYFKRYGKGTTISPVKVTDAEDQRMLQRYFDKRVEKIQQGNNSTSLRLLRVQSDKTRLTVMVARGLSEGDDNGGLCLYESLQGLQSGTIDISVDSAADSRN